MASETNLESSLPEVISETMSSIQLTSKSRKNRSNIYNFCRTVPKGEERDSYRRLLYFYNRCDFKASLMMNF